MQVITALMKLTASTNADEIVVHSAKDTFSYGAFQGAGGCFKSTLVHRSGDIKSSSIVYKVAFFFGGCRA